MCEKGPVVCVVLFWCVGFLSTASSDPERVSVHQVPVLRRCLDHEPLGNRNTYRKGKLSSPSSNRKWSPVDQNSCYSLWLCFLHSQYGVSLYENYKTAEKKAAVSSAWTNRSTPSSSNPSTPSPTIKGSTTHESCLYGVFHRCKTTQMWWFFFTCTVCSLCVFLLLC